MRSALAESGWVSNHGDAIRLYLGVTDASHKPERSSLAPINLLSRSRAAISNNSIVAKRAPSASRIRTHSNTALCAERARDWAVASCRLVMAKVAQRCLDRPDQAFEDEIVTRSGGLSSESVACGVEVVLALLRAEEIADFTDG